MTDREMIEGILQRDRAAINFLVSSYQRKVIKTAYYFIGNIEDAEDLSQEIFLEVIKSIGSFRGNASFSTWLYRIIMNRSLNVIKRNSRRAIFSNIEQVFRKAMNVEDTEGKEPSEAHDQMAEKETAEFVKEAISSLPENQRTAFVLSKYEELPYKEIADIMDTTVSSVESLIHRAKMNLQNKLVKQFSQYSKK
jgi:RNA polymerase sigma-70 factor (ECF subfamily)